MYLKKVIVNAKQKLGSIYLKGDTIHRKKYFANVLSEGLKYGG
jgi:hypothetical protein